MTIRACHVAWGLLLAAAAVCAASAVARPATDAASERAGKGQPPRSVGVILQPSEQDALARMGALLVDEVMSRLGTASVECVVLTERSAVLADASLTLPDLTQPWPAQERALRDLASAAGLTDLVVLRLSAKAGDKDPRRQRLAVDALWLVSGSGADAIALLGGDVSDGAARDVATKLGTRLLGPTPTTQLASEKPADVATPADTKPAPNPKPTTSPIATPTTPPGPPPATTAAAPIVVSPTASSQGAAQASVAAPSSAPATTAPTGEPATPPGAKPAATTATVGDKPQSPSKPAAPGPAELPPAYDAAIRALGEGDLAKALDLANRALDEGAPRGRVCTLRAMIFAAQHDIPAEMRELEAAIDADPRLVEPRLNLAELQNQRGLWQEAVKTYKGAIEQDKTVGNAYIGLSRLYEANRQPRAAQETLEQGAQAASDDALLLLELGDLYMRRGATRQAETTYTNAARVGDTKNRVDALQKLGDLYASTQRYREAFICYAELSRSHDAGASVMAEKRYHQVMGVVDKAAAKALDDAFDLLGKYVEGPQPGQGEVSRVEAYQAATEAVRQLKDVATFAADTLPPPNLKAEHAQRELYYSVATEGAVAAQGYLDTGDKELLKVARERLADAHAEQARLVQMASGASG